MEDAASDPQEQHLKKPRYKIEGKTPHQQVEARPEEDERMWNESKGVLARFHVNFRQQSFKPTDVDNCPIGFIIDYNLNGGGPPCTLRMGTLKSSLTTGTKRSNINLKDGKVARNFNWTASHCHGKKRISQRTQGHTRNQDANRRRLKQRGGQELEGV